MLKRPISRLLAIACIAVLIALLRNRGGAQRPIVAVKRLGQSPAGAPIDDSRLDRRIHEVRFNKVNLADAVDTLSRLTGANIYLDVRSLEAERLRRPVLVQMTLRNLTLDEALIAIESRFAGQIWHRAADGVITVSAVTDEWNDHPIDVTTEIYDVRELLALIARSNPRQPGDAVLILEQFVLDCAPSVFWREHAGSIGRAREFDGLLLVTQYPQSQRLIFAQLEKARRALLRNDPFPSAWEGRE